MEARSHPAQHDNTIANAQSIATDNYSQSTATSKEKTEMAACVESLQRQKLEIEIKKLQRETGFVQFAPIFQSIFSIFNPIALVFIAILTLFLYQRPQNEQTALNRQFDEKQAALNRQSEEIGKVGASIAAAFTMSDKNDRLGALKILQEQYPHQSVIITAQKIAEEDLKIYKADQQKIFELSQAPGRYMQDECKSLLEEIRGARSDLRKIMTEHNTNISGTGLEEVLGKNLLKTYDDSRVTFLKKSIIDFEKKRKELKC